MTTNPLTLAAVRAIKEEAEKRVGWQKDFDAAWIRCEILQKDTTQMAARSWYTKGRVNQSVADDAVPALCGTIETLVEALRLMHDERVHFHMEDAGHNDEKQECCFCTFGDRAENDIIECSYCKVKAILATIDRPSAEAQTEGDGG